MQIMLQSKYRDTDAQRNEHIFKVNMWGIHVRSSMLRTQVEKHVHDD